MTSTLDMAQALRLRLERAEKEVRQHQAAQRLRLFVERGGWKIDPHVVGMAAADLAALDLEIEPPIVCLGTLEREPWQKKALGWTYRNRKVNRIWLTPGLCLCDATRVSAHEVRHRYQFRNGTVRASKDEADAVEYEKRFVQKFLAGVRCGACGSNV